VENTLIIQPRNQYITKDYNKAINPNTDLIQKERCVIKFWFGWFFRHSTKIIAINNSNNGDSNVINTSSSPCLTDLIKLMLYPNLFLL